MLVSLHLSCFRHLVFIEEAVKLVHHPLCSCISPVVPAVRGSFSNGN